MAEAASGEGGAAARIAYVAARFDAWKPLVPKGEHGCGGFDDVALALCGCSKPKA